MDYEPIEQHHKIEKKHCVGLLKFILLVGFIIVDINKHI